MAGINQINCLNLVKNSGIQACFLDPKFMSGSIHAPRGFQFDVTANTGNMQTTLAAAFYASSKAARLYPFYDFEKPTDASDKLTLQSMPNGAKHPVREGYNDWSFQYFDGGLTQHQAARTFNGSNWDFYFIDSDPQRSGIMKIYGIQGSTSSMLRAFPVNPGGFFWAHPWTLNTGTELSAYMLQYSFLQKYTNDLIRFVEVPFDFPTVLPGLQDVVLSSPSANATPGSFNVAVTSLMGTDIATQNATALAVAGLWTANNATSGASITPSSVTFVPPVGTALGYFTIAMPTTAPPYPASGNVLINLGVPATLVAAGLDYESTGAVSIVKN